MYYDKEETLASNQAKAKAEIDMLIALNFRQKLEAIGTGYCTSKTGR